MEKSKILNELIGLMKELVPNSSIDYSKITMDSKLKEDLNFDSLSMLLMAIGIETKFSIQLNELNYQLINSVSNIVNYIYEKLN